MHTIKVKHSLSNGGHCVLQHPNAQPGWDGDLFTGEVRNVPDDVTAASVVWLYQQTTFFPWKSVCDYAELADGKIVNGGVPLSTADAGKLLGISASRVRQLILQGRLPAQRRGYGLAISPLDLWMVDDRPNGRPKAG